VRHPARRSSSRARAPARPRRGPIASSRRPRLLGDNDTAHVADVARAAVGEGRVKLRGGQGERVQEQVARSQGGVMRRERGQGGGGRVRRDRGLTQGQTLSTWCKEEPET
jgi:hypothetical protein